MFPDCGREEEGHVGVELHRHIKESWQKHSLLF